MKWHTIIDFETLGSNSKTCAVLDVSILHFDWERFTSEKPYSPVILFSDVKQVKLSVEDQVKNYGFSVDESTLEFWSKQDKEVRSRIKPLSTDRTLPEAAFIIGNTLNEKSSFQRWWSRSNSFDPVILDRIFEAAGNIQIIQNRLKHYLVRDTRSFIEGSLGTFSGDNAFVPVSGDPSIWENWFKKHDSRYDVVADVLRLQALVRANSDLPMINFQGL